MGIAQGFSECARLRQCLTVSLLRLKVFVLTQLGIGPLVLAPAGVAFNRKVS